MLKALTKKVDDSHEQMGNFSSKMETPRKSQMKMLEIKTHTHTHTKNMISEVKNSFNGLTSNLTQLSKESVNLKTDQ